MLSACQTASNSAGKTPTVTSDTVFITPQDLKVREVQLALTALGYRPGPADGYLSKRTREAILAFKKDIGVEQRSIIDDGLIEALEARDWRSTEATPNGADAAEAKLVWSGVDLPVLRGASDRQEIDSKAIASALRSTYVVLARNRSKANLGSGIAVSERILLTNCHTFRDQYNIIVGQKTEWAIPEVLLRNDDRDQCVLRIRSADLVPVSGIRRFATLRVGEPVFAVGTPHGVEDTVTQGKILDSGYSQGQRLILSSAFIDQGSSGGGLFDAAGNLIGITTRTSRDGWQNLSIAAEEFLDR